MMKDKNTLIAVILIFILAQVLAWFQTFAQFKWEWMSKHIWFTVLCSLPIGYLWIVGVKMGMDVFDGKTWPIRFLGFCVGILVFTVLSSYVLGETLNLKNIISLILCFIIVVIQLP